VDLRLDSPRAWFLGAASFWRKNSDSRLALLLSPRSERARCRESNFASFSALCDRRLPRSHRSARPRSPLSLLRESRRARRRRFARAVFSCEVGAERLEPLVIRELIRRLLGRIVGFVERELFLSLCLSATLRLRSLSVGRRFLSPPASLLQRRLGFAFHVGEEFVEDFFCSGVVAAF